LAADCAIQSFCSKNELLPVDLQPIGPKLKQHLKAVPHVTYFELKWFTGTQLNELRWWKLDKHRFLWKVAN
jgi:hypothetical protein